MIDDIFFLDIIFVNNSWKDWGYFLFILIDEVLVGVGCKNK